MKTVLSTITLVALVFASATTFTFAQRKNPTPNEIRIPIKAESWDFKAGNTKFVEHNGVSSIEMAGDIVTAKNIDFANGTIEFDVELKQGFFSLYFHRQSDDEGEIFYFRDPENPETSNSAIQYTCIIKKVNMWDMHPDYQAAAAFKKGEWTHVKLVISGLQMLVYVNDKTRPALQVFRLEGNTKTGMLAFQGLGFVSNVVLKPNQTEGLPPTEGFDPTYNDVRYVRNWQVSEPAPLPSGQELTNGNMPDIQTKWQPITAERRGLINLSRIYGQSDTRRYVWLRTKVVSKKAQKVKMDLGFSDEVWVFVNDKATYVDKNLFAQNLRKAPEGRISIENSSFEIPLNEGENDLVIGLANDFYGWGIIPRLETLDGLTLNTNFPKEEINKEFEKLFGVYASKQIPTKIKISQKNNKLSALPTAESPILFEHTGGNTFKMEQYGMTLEFFPAENRMIFKGGTQVFEFTRESN